MPQKIEFRILYAAIVESARRRKLLVEQPRETFICIRLRIVVGLHAVRLGIRERVAVYRKKEFCGRMRETHIYACLQFP